MKFASQFFLLVLTLSLAELYLLVEVAARLGFGATLLLCLLTGFLGGSLVRRQGLRTLGEIQSKLGSGHLPSEDIVSGLILLAIGIFLIMPGFITDTLGFLMLVPWIRRMVARLLAGYFSKRMLFSQKGTTGFSGFAYGTANPSARNRRNEDIIIEVDAEERVPPH